MTKIKLSYIDQICQKYGGFTLSDYLTYSSHQYALYSFDKAGQLKWMDGLEDPKLTAILQGKGGFSSTIWAAYAMESVMVDGNVVEVFFFNDKLFKKANKDLLELLTFHEVCHLLDQTEYYQVLNLNFTKADEQVGQELSRIADKVMDLSGGWNDWNCNNKVDIRLSCNILFV